MPQEFHEKKKKITLSQKVEENVTHVDGSRWTLNDGALQKSGQHRENILRNGMGQDTEESTKACQGSFKDP